MVPASASSQSLEQAWKFKTTARVLASPVLLDETIYIGDERGVFYAIDARTGRMNWKYETKGNIQAKACATTDAVFFESANNFYALDPANGKLLWKFVGREPFSHVVKDKTVDCKIDPFDDKRSSAIENEGVFYVGTGWGKLYGFDAIDGSIRFEMESADQSAIRSTPLLEEGELYFGDWNGLVYCVDLKTRKIRWKKKTYRHKPYATFGGVVSEFEIHDGMLFFGARNFMMNVLLAEDGQKEWTYTDPEKGWMIGDPVVFDDTLYVGGSDNFSMYAFDPATGQRKWVQNGGRNIYTKPLLTQEWLIYTGGNAYDADDFGTLFLLNRENGQVLGQFKTTKGIFSSPILIDDLVIFGCYDHFVHAVSIKPVPSK